MPENTSQPWRVDLGDGLVMRHAECAADLERIAECGRRAFGEDELYTVCHDLYTKHPRMRWEDILYVEDTRTGLPVSMISLIPLQWHYGDVLLKVAELGPVGTVPEYRRRGLIRAQMKVFERKLQDEGYDLGAIEGIPYFYRQFGYEYAIPLNQGWRLIPDDIPDLPAGAVESAAIRRMTPADLPQVSALYETATRGLCLRAARDEAIWRFPEELSSGYPDRLTSHVLERDERIVGYLRIRDKPDNGLPVREAITFTYDDSLAALRFAKGLAREQGQARIAINGTPSQPIIKTASYLGARANKPYAWQVRIPHRVPFLQRIAPVLERRLAESMLAGLTQTLHLNFYEEAVELEFARGRLVEVRSVGRSDRGEIRLPPYPAVRLLLGYHSREEISAYRPDLGVRASLQPVVDALFPKVESYIYWSV